MPDSAAAPPPAFDTAFRAELTDLFRWRRDVRRFRPDPLPQDLVGELLAIANLAPSVGCSQPWRFVQVESEAARRAIRDDFAACNHEALNDYAGERAKLYARLKLAGLEAAPVQLAVFCDETTLQGHGLGRKTMPEMLRYSVVTAVHTLWLAARAWGVGVGWVSILDPAGVKSALDVPEDWSLIAYLCLGFPQAEDDTPELEREGWESRRAEGASVIIR